MERWWRKCFSWPRENGHKRLSNSSWLISFWLYSWQCDFFSIYNTKELYNYRPFVLMNECHWIVQELIWHFIGQVILLFLLFFHEKITSDHLDNVCTRTIMNNTMQKLTTNIPGFPTFRNLNEQNRSHWNKFFFFVFFFSQRHPEYRFTDTSEFDCRIDLRVRHLHECQCIVFESIVDAWSSPIHNSNARVSDDGERRKKKIWQVRRHF